MSPDLLALAHAFDAAHPLASTLAGTAGSLLASAAGRAAWARLFGTRPVSEAVAPVARPEPRTDRAPASHTRAIVARRGGSRGPVLSARRPLSHGPMGAAADAR